MAEIAHLLVADSRPSTKRLSTARSPSSGTIVAAPTLHKGSP